MYHLIQFLETDSYAVRRSLKTIRRYKLLCISNKKEILKSVQKNLSLGLPRIYLELKKNDYDEFQHSESVDLINLNFSRSSDLERNSIEEPFQDSDEEWLPPSPETSTELSVSGETDILFNTPLTSEKVLLSENIDQRKLERVKRRLFEKDSSNTQNCGSTVVKENLNVETSIIKRKKKHLCIYCKKMIMNFSRHLEKIHSDQPLVKKMMEYPKGVHERLKIIEEIRKNGDFLHNTDNVYNTGKLIVRRRPQEVKQRSVNHFIACPRCKGFYSKLSLRKHYFTCSGQKIRPHGKTLFAKARALQRYIHPSANTKLATQIFPHLRNDDITTVIKYDELAILYGNEQCEKYKSQHLHKMIRARLRLVGHFILKVKNIHPEINKFKDVFHPKYYKVAIQAIQMLGRLKEDGKFEAPATVSNARAMIVTCADILDRHYLIHRLQQHREEVKDFLILFKPAFRTSVSRTVQETKLKNFRRKEMILPNINDIKKIYTYLKENRRKLFTELSENFSYSKWEQFVSLNLTSVQIFNCRRSGEIERFLIKDYETYQSVEENDLFNAMSKNAKKVAKLYGRCSLRGKLGRTVLIIISKEIKSSIDLILSLREEAGVPRNNPYVFGIPSEDERFRYLDACQLLTKFSVQCDAINPESLRATILRKHFGTHYVTMELQENDMKHYYKLPIVAKDVTILTKYLLNAQGEDHDTKTIHRKNILDEPDNSDQLNTSEVLELNKDTQCNRGNKQNKILATYGNEGTKLKNDLIIPEHITSTNNLFQESLIITENCGEREQELITQVDEDIKRLAKENFVENFCSEFTDDNKMCLEEIITVNDPKHENKVIITNDSKHSNEEIIANYPKQPNEDIITNGPKHPNKESESNDLEVPRDPMYISKPNTVESSGKRYIKRTWSTPEKQIMRKCFYHYLRSKKLPSLVECAAVREEYKHILGNRQPQTLKAWINDQNKRISKNAFKATWNTLEKRIMRRLFEYNLTYKVLPSRAECAEVISKNPVLKNRTAKMVKAWIKDQI